MPFSLASRAPRALRTLTVLFATTALLPACMLFARPPEDLDYSRTRVSEGGAYRATINPIGDTIPMRKLHRWALRLESANGAPVERAEVIVDGGMPQHGHGLPSKPRARQVAAGEYVVDGMKFNMGGWWVVNVHVASAAGSDSVVFNLKL